MAFKLSNFPSKYLVLLLLLGLLVWAMPWLIHGPQVLMVLVSKESRAALNQALHAEQQAQIRWQQMAQLQTAVARALAMSPVLILADEPTGNLDTKSADAVFELLWGVSQNQGTSVLFVTHNPLLSARCDRTIEVVDGCISAS